MRTAIRFLAPLTALGALSIAIIWADGTINATASPKATAVDRGSKSDPGRDPRLYGVWIPKTYMYNGKAHPMNSGLMVITPTYLIADAIYDLSGAREASPDGNANYGTYGIVAPGLLVMHQAMQLHWRSGSGYLVKGDRTMFNRNVPERIKYKVTGDILIFYFQVAGKQSWIMKRAAAETCTPPAG